MTCLCLDTSTPYCVVSIVRGSKMLWGERRLFGKDRSEGLFLLIKKGLKKTAMTLADMTALAVGRGPGSFTGLRIGLSAVKGFSFALSLPVFSFSSLDAIAHNANSSDLKKLSVVVDARRGNVYTRLYRRKSSGELMAVKKEQLIPAVAWAGNLSSGTVVSGDGVKEYASELKGQFASLAEESWYPSCESISSLAVLAAQAGAKTDAQGLKAVYLYPRDCQVAKTQSHKSQDTKTQDTSHRTQSHKTQDTRRKA